MSKDWSEQIDRRFDRIEQLFDDFKDWMHMLVGGFQVRAGRRLEDVVAGTLRLALRRPDIQPDRIHMRQKVLDEKGTIGPAGREYEVDMLTDDGQTTVFEIKSVCEVEDVDRLADKVTLLRALRAGQKVEGVIVALGVEEGVEARCAGYNIPLVH